MANFGQHTIPFFKTKLLKRVLKQKALDPDPIAKTREVKEQVAKQIKKLETEEKKKRLDKWRQEIQKLLKSAKMNQL